MVVADVVTVVPSVAGLLPFAAEAPRCEHLGTAASHESGCVSVSGWEGLVSCPVCALMA